MPEHNGSREPSLQVLLLCGPEDPSRAAFALQMALAALCSDTSVSVFLALRATFWACRGSVEQSGFDEVHEQLQRLIDHGARVTCCSTCAERWCGGGEGALELIEGIELAGMTATAVRAARGTSTLVF